MTTLTVFDPQLVPTDTIADFLHWHDLTTEWVEDRDYTSTEGTSSVLLPWLDAMRGEFTPVVNGANETTRYIIGSDCVYARLADSISQAAVSRAKELAQELNLGLYIAGSGKVLMPGFFVLD